VSALSRVLRSQEGNQVAFWCPGCNTAHGIPVGAGGWAGPGDVDRPTFQPSILVRSGHHASHYKPGQPCWCSYYAENPPAPGERRFECSICHSFVTDGRIQFLSDCTHKLAGQTVDIPEFP